ncbi:hypothetical protein PanWU01x14_149540 [Parasponia andersonii]|uniref:Uncharacterized protein n=1 Tax=Parasponia andersonii TaxID=3476 RepID=A0A2P5CIL5_PARAD|nr:hypothetical protein PanWU01x14_149540 [Parasponia andersonii]
MGKGRWVFGSLSLRLNFKGWGLRIYRIWSNIDGICSYYYKEVRTPAAGSKGAPKNPGELKVDTSSMREENPSNFVKNSSSMEDGWAGCS